MEVENWQGERRKDMAGAVVPSTIKSVVSMASLLVQVFSFWYKSTMSLGQLAMQANDPGKQTMLIVLAVLSFAFGIVIVVAITYLACLAVSVFVTGLAFTFAMIILKVVFSNFN